MLRLGSLRLLVLCCAVLLAGGDAHARILVKWDKRLPRDCEPPAVFYSSQHKPGAKPCCATAVGMCAGGVACPVTGVCPGTGVACAPGEPAPRPNFVVGIADDLGACHFGTSPECRSPQTGTPTRPPSTPNLDVLAGYGTVFPVAHNVASWCFPSLISIATGRYQRTFGGVPRPANTSGTIATSLRSLDGDPSALDDPYNAGNKVGGYCTFLGGKLSASLGDNGFDARARTGERVFGRSNCVADTPGGYPKCGTEAGSSYEPANVFRTGDVFQFLDGMQYVVPGSSPAAARVQNFLLWYAPRIPHQPLRSPNPIREYLFGYGAAYPRGGLFDLGALCSGNSCPPTVTAMSETNFGDVYEMYANIWWMDDGIRELRKFFHHVSQPHCLGSNGRNRFDITTPGACPGTWVESVTPDLARNTVFLFLADNGWHLPSSKHSYTENGYRTRMIVFDPRTLPEVPSWDPTQVTPPTPYESNGLAHAVDVRATAVAMAMDTPGEAACPQGADGTPCDGRDLRAHLATAPGGPAAPETLRRALCGHETNKPTSPNTNRFLLTRPGAVGRCTNLDAPICATNAQCGAGEFCLGGHCMPAAEPACTTSAQCPTGAACLGKKCRVAPACLTDTECSAFFPSGTFGCVEPETKWCRNAPNQACSTHSDCPACPDGGACARVCEARSLKFYDGTGTLNGKAEVSDLFLDPDERRVHGTGPGDLIHDMGSISGPYASAIRGAGCCLDDWWASPARAGVLCNGGVCPTAMTCNQ